ncbi:uncharacterized protein C2orf78 homolog, partial [Nannospalax galili]|uniref:uncharacterized protein C2orf78 homolog n=1 Tax=Nannospalax galili TaxID=1026970 RepID=UPI00111C3B0A
LVPRGKLKLVPLPFLTMDETQIQAVFPRALSLASRRSPPSSTYLVGPAKPALTISLNATAPGGRNSIQSSTVPQVAAARPAPYKTSSYSSLQKKPVSAALTKDTSPPKNQSQYLLQDFCCQPIPWRKVNIPGSLISHPITAQRPEQEAMKWRAQQEQEKAANDTTLRKQQVFLQRENDMEISRYYGYAM